MPLNDPQIRGPLRKWIREREEPTMIADELPVQEGRARIDLAAVFDDIHAYEIKGQTDRLVRLKNQTKTFAPVCRRCTPVTPKNHLKSLPKHIPEWWGIVLATSSDLVEGDVEFEVVRPAQENEALEWRPMARMLWKDEMLNIFEHYGHVLSERTPKRILILKLREILPTVEDLWDEVLQALLSRRYDGIWKAHHLHGLERDRVI
jgi:hypothetical protein